MKKLSFILALSAILLSCKKERTCSCNITTSGTINSRALSAGLTFTFGFNLPGLPIPVVIPPITIIGSKDTSFVTPYSYASTSKETYEKISNRSLKGSCPTTKEESIGYTSTDLVPGSYTVTSTNTGTKKSSCKIE